MENNCPEPPTNHHQPAIYDKNAQSLSQATGNALEKRAQLESFLGVERAFNCSQFNSKRWR